jgi:hypothetical protein
VARVGYCFGFFNLDGFVSDTVDSGRFTRQFQTRAAADVTHAYWRHRKCAITSLASE